MRDSWIGVEGRSALVPLRGITVEALTLEKAGDGQDVGGRGRHYLDAGDAVGGRQEESRVGGVEVAAALVLYCSYHSQRLTHVFSPGCAADPGGHVYVVLAWLCMYVAFTPYDPRATTSYLQSIINSTNPKSSTVIKTL